MGDTDFDYYSACCPWVTAGNKCTAQKTYRLYNSELFPEYEYCHEETCAPYHFTLQLIEAARL